MDVIVLPRNLAAATPIHYTNQSLTGVQRERCGGGERRESNGRNHG